jgi:hypothetical protein
MKPQLTPILWLLAAALGTVSAAHAWPNTSPSAKAAARLKYHPPANWLQHYLPDDRYKIAGGVWKVVSTQYDTYYHRPDSPNMLRQPAGIVIGFSSEQEARDAGYKPDGLYFPGMIVRSTHSSVIRNRAGTRGRGTATGTRVTLSDGASTAILPQGWLHLKSSPRQVRVLSGNSQLLEEVFASPDKKQGVKFAFSIVPRSINLEPFVTLSWTKRNVKNVSNHLGGLTGAGTGNAFNLTAGRLAGMNAVRWTLTQPSKAPQGSPRFLVAAARRNKVYFVALLNLSSPTERAIIQSFRPA